MGLFNKNGAVQITSGIPGYERDDPNSHPLLTLGYNFWHSPGWLSLGPLQCTVESRHVMAVTTMRCQGFVRSVRASRGCARVLALALLLAASAGVEAEVIMVYRWEGGLGLWGGGWIGSRKSDATCWGRGV